MKNKVTPFLLFVLMMTFSCYDTGHSTNEETADDLIFPKGELITNKNFTGEAYLQMLIDADSINTNSVGSVTFLPGARTRWHTHPAGQIILGLDGVGYYQELGKPKEIIRKGDAIKCPPGNPHWPGASSDSHFVQVAISGREKGEVVWMDEVTDKEYHESFKR